jgi:hypothetical protein
MPLLRHLLAAAFLLFLGCASAPLKTSLPPAFSVQEVASVGEEGPFALSPDGRTAVYVRDGTKLKRLPDGEEIEISPETATAAAWSPDGGVVAFAFPYENGSLLALYGPDGKEKRNARIPLPTTSLGWAQGELLALSTEIRQFRFGGNVKVVLYRWQGKEPQSAVLYDNTLRPAVMKKVDTIRKIVRLVVSPWEDEILYPQIHDPPAFQPNMRLALHNLVTGAERVFETAVPLTAAAVYSPDGETVIAGSGEAETSIFDPWKNRDSRFVPSAGSRITRSPGGTFILIDGTLYRNGEVLAAFPPDAVGLFAESALLVRSAGRLYLVNGFPAETSTVPPKGEKRDRLLTLREWRSKSLLSTEEYRNAAERLLKQ